MLGGQLRRRSLLEIDRGREGERLLGMGNEGNRYKIQMLALQKMNFEKTWLLVFFCK